MTKTEFAKRYQAAAKVSSVAKATEQIDAMFDVLAQVLHETGSHRVPGFGTWQVKQRPAYKGRNPMTGEPIKIKASKAVGFKASKTLRDRVQKAPRKAKAA